MILIDVGNSSIKWCEAGESLGPVHRTSRSADQLALDLQAKEIAQQSVWLSSVADEAFDDTLSAALTAIDFDPVHRLVTPATQRGLVNSYQDPAKMGVDRWLAMLGAWDGHHRALVVVDVGTALTIDLVAADGRHEGGYILPGLRLMEQSLFRDTQRVRYDQGLEPSLGPGMHTGACVRSGLWAAAFGAVHLVLQQHPDHHLIVTGGDGQALLSLGLNGEWRPNLVLEGLAITARG